MGLVFDPASNAIRPILGIPGAAILGEPLELPLKLRKTAISPMQDYVLATSGEHNQVFLLSMGRVPVTSVMIQGADRGPDQIVVSAGGIAAALYYKDRNRVQLLSGLPGSPRISAELYLSAGRPLDALAVSDDGRTLLAGMGDSVYWVSPNGEAPILTGLHKIASIALGSNHTALVADNAGNQIHRVRDVTGAAEADLVAGPGQGISAPVAVAMSRDNQRAFVVNGKTGTVAILDLHAKTEIAKLSCACKPTGLDRLTGDDIFRLTELSSRPLWVLEAAAHRSRILFVPGDLPRSNKK